MTLTKQDLQAIQNIVVDTTAPMFERVFERFDGLETRMGRAEERLDRIDTRLDKMDARLDKIERVQDEHTTLLTTHSQALERLEKKVDNIDGRLQAVEADVKELYKMVAQTKHGMPTSFSKLTAEEKVVKTYQDVLALAKEMNIILPR